MLTVQHHWVDDRGILQDLKACKSSLLCSQQEILSHVYSLPACKTDRVCGLFWSCKPNGT